MCSYEKPGRPSYRDLRHRAGNFPIKTGQPGYRDEDFSSTQVTVEEDEISIILTYL